MLDGGGGDIRLISSGFIAVINCIGPSYLITSVVDNNDQNNQFLCLCISLPLLKNLLIEVRFLWIVLCSRR